MPDHWVTTDDGGYLRLVCAKGTLLPARSLRMAKANRATLAQVGLSRSILQRGLKRDSEGLRVNLASAKRPKLKPSSVPGAAGRKRRAAAAKKGEGGEEEGDEEEDEEEDEDEDAADDDDADDASYQVDRLMATRRQQGGRRQFLVR